MTLVCVVLRSDGEDRFIDTVNLFDYGFDNFHLSPVYWMDREEPAGYVALPKGVESNVLTVKDSDIGNVRTRTYSYQGTEVYRTQVNLPVTFDSSEASVSFTPLFYQVKGIDFLLPVMIGITGILCIAEFSLIFLSIIKRRK